MPSRSDSRTVYTTESGRICPDCGQPIAACRCHMSIPNGNVRKNAVENVRFFAHSMSAEIL